MTITATCESCQRVIRAKDEYAGKRVRCPGCQSPVTIPAADLELDLGEDFPLEPAIPSPTLSNKAKSKPAARGSSSTSERLRRHWHWLVAAVVLLIAPLPTVGFAVAVLVMLVGSLMALVGGVAPFIRVIVGAPGTVLTMLVSRSARFEMMRQPDNHPYKVLVRTAFTPTRGLFWRGVLLMFLILPAGKLHGLAGEFFRNLAARSAAATPDPPQPAWLTGPGPSVSPHLPGQPPAPNAENRMGQPPVPATGGQDIQDVQSPRNSREPRPPWQPPDGQPPFGPPQRRLPSAHTENSIRTVTVTFGGFEGAGTAAQAMASVVNSFSGYVADSLDTSNGEGPFTFQHQGNFDPRALGMSLSSHGFRTIQFNVLGQPGR